MHEGSLSRRRGSPVSDEIVTLGRGQPSFFERHVKRAMDVVLVLLSLPVVLPIVAIMALLVMRDGGSAFYAQRRVGRNGEEFSCWKLRSMVVDADEKLKAHLESDRAARTEWRIAQKLMDDPRITPIGRFIRRTSLDELPQLWCVLKGEMSLVGPRPFVPDQAPLYHGQAYYRLRPGLTGLWQVMDRNASSFSSRVGYDNRYAEEISFRTDLGIMFRTLGVVVKGTGV